MSDIKALKSLISNNSPIKDLENHLVMAEIAEKLSILACECLLCRLPKSRCTSCRVASEERLFRYYQQNQDEYRKVRLKSSCRTSCIS